MLKNWFSLCLAQRFCTKNKLDLNRSDQMMGTKVNVCFDILKNVKTIHIFAELSTNTI